MANINSLYESNKKRLDLSEMFPPDGFITLKKLSHSVNSRIKLLSMSGALSKVALRLATDIKEGVLDPDHDMDDTEIGKYILGLPQAEKEEMTGANQELIEIYIANGIDPDKHNLFIDNVLIKANDYNFWDQFPQFLDFLIEEIKSFNKDEGLGLKKNI